MFKILMAGSDCISLGATSSYIEFLGQSDELSDLFRKNRRILIYRVCYSEVQNLFAVHFPTVYSPILTVVLSLIAAIQNKGRTFI